MESINLLENLSVALMGKPFVLELLDLLVKSSLIVGVTLAVTRPFRSKLSNNGSHLLWLNCLLCIALLPVAGSALTSLTASVIDQGVFTIIAVRPGDIAAATTSAVDSNLLFAIAYSLVAAGLLLRLLLSAFSLRRINIAAELVSRGALAGQLLRISRQQGISRPVVLKFSNDINSPMSFGLMRPVVVLPTTASGWSESTLEDVLLHELSHIKRLDWPTMLFCHLLCAIFWINPLVWFAKHRVNDTAEQACDSAVLTQGRNGINYAEDLLRLARLTRGQQAPILAQLMFEESGLSIRIKNILEGRLSGQITKAFMTALFALTAVAIVTFSMVDVFGASVTKPDGDFLPITAIAPLYPTRAAELGIEGWILVSFTVGDDGSVLSNSVAVVDAEPPDIFDRSAVGAAEKFLFKPRIVDGIPVEVPGVQYLFRYALEDDSAYEDVTRPPPVANE